MAQSLNHVSGGLDRNIQDFVQFIRADQLGPTVSLVDRLKPFVQRRVAAAENRAMHEIELLPAGIALVASQARRCAVQLTDFASHTTAWAYLIARPDNLLQYALDSDTRSVHRRTALACRYLHFPGSALIVPQ